jgi:hypothetical protein
MPTYSVTGTVTGTGGETTLKSDELEYTDTELLFTETAPTTINVGTFTVPSPGGTYTFKIKSPVLPSTTYWRHGGTLATINFLAPASAGTATFTVQPTTVAEGAEANFTVTTTDIQPGTALGWRLVHVGVISNDSHYDPSYGTVGSITLDNTTAPKGSFKIKTLLDGMTNPTGYKKEFKIQITKAGTVIATSNTIEVTEGPGTPGSLGPTYALALSPTSVDEGNKVTGTITVTNPSITPTVINWQLVDISSPYNKSANRYFSTSGSVTVPANGTSATFDISVYEDNLDSPGKTFKVMLTNVNGVRLIGSAVGPVTVNDTSKSPVTAVAAAGGSLTVISLNRTEFITGPSVGATIEELSTDHGSFLYVFPDGTWQIKQTNSSDINGNWFTPTTPGIGNSHFIKITKTIGPVTGGLPTVGEHSPDVPLSPLNSMQFVGAMAYGYKCVDPEVEILVDSDGTTRLAADLEIGDEVYTMHESTKIWGYYKVLNHEIFTQPKLLLTFNDGTTLLASKSHKVYLGSNIWKTIDSLSIGERLVTFSGVMKELASSEDMGEGPVVSMEIDSAHTYVANEILSHNKVSGAQYHYASYSVSYQIEISKDSAGTGKQFATISLGGSIGDVAYIAGDPNTYYTGDGGDTGDSGDSGDS